MTSHTKMPECGMKVWKNTGSPLRPFGMFKPETLEIQVTMLEAIGYCVVLEHYRGLSQQQSTKTTAL
jgi:hypothetical protein